MNHLNDTLPDLMRRATENLEPESTDLVERGMRRGTTLRRRRTALLGLSGAGAVLATAGIVVGGTQLFGGPPADAPVAGTQAGPLAQAKPRSTPATHAQTLATLRALLPDNLSVSSASSYDENSTHHASMLVDDGRGASLLRVITQTTVPVKNCNGLHGTCRVQADGTVVTSYENESIFPYDPEKNPEGVRNTVVELFHPDGRSITLYNFNATKDRAVRTTRPAPALSAATLRRIAASPEWVFPGRHEGQLDPGTKGPGAGKAAVPVAQTLETLKSVLPAGLQLSRPQTWGGGSNGFNGAAYVADDGRGKARIEVLVRYEEPLTECPDEGFQHCKVRADKAVVSWSAGEKTDYSPKTNSSEHGILANRVEIRYADGRTIGLTSYNGPQEKDAPRTRTQPAFTTDQLLAMAGNQAWKFPGSGTN